MPITTSAAQLVAAASQQITTLAAQQVLQAQQAGMPMLLVDVRDVRELQAEGTVVGAMHAPRCLLEFWVDPTSPYFKPVFADESKRLVLFCGLGWRSALAAKTLQDMGLTNVAHIAGGFEAMKAAGMAVEKRSPPT